MVKRRVYEVARELGISSSELMRKLHELGIEKGNQLQALTQEEYAAVTEVAKKPKTKAAAERAAAAPEKAATAKAGAKQPASAVAVAPPPAPAPPPRPLVARPAVVTILGHVDHGKTTLLDQIRQSHVAADEAGGITQSIGAYQVEHHGKKISFIDTPGHRAFTNMRARGAQVTDIAVLVVAADDGVMEQTREAISHARVAQVPLIVAINKIDKPGIQLDRIKEQLHKEGLTPEDWGGETVVVPVSALSGQGVPELLEMILLVAELRELKADPEAKAKGVIIESYLDTSKGPVATAIIRDGTLRERDIVLAGAAQGRIRALLDDRGKRVAAASPGTPVQILGLSEVPPAGAPLEVCPNLLSAKAMAEQRLAEQRQKRLQQGRRSLSDILQQRASKKDVFKLILKSDTMGTLEAVERELKSLQVGEVELEILHSGVGNINENDIVLASTAHDTAVIGFRVQGEPKALELAAAEGVTVRTYDVIYQISDDVKRALRSLVAPQYQEVKLGEADVRNTFKIPSGVVAGCYVREGMVTRDAKVRVRRKGSLIFEGQLASLKRFTEDARRVEKDKECGIKIQNFDDVEVGDVLEFYTLQPVDRL